MNFNGEELTLMMLYNSGSRPGFHNAAAVGRVVFLSHGVTSFLARKGA